MSHTDTLEHADISNKTVIIRLDLNVPMNGDAVSDTTRIDRILPTLLDLSKRQAKAVIITHFGRPKGSADPEFSLARIMPTLQQKLGGITLHFAPDCIGDAAKEVIDAAGFGDIILCENVRFYAGETAGDDAFARKMAALGDIYVNDAFSCSHRAHASITGISNHLPAYFGYAMQAELSALESVFETPQRPVAALVGGSKVSTKMDLLQHLVTTMDIIMIGGGMANTFLYAQGHDVGKSLCEKDLTALACDILKKANEHGCEIVLPTDVAAATSFAAHADCVITGADNIPDDAMALDIGPASAAAFCEAISRAKTLVWNGPVGAFELTPFDNATVTIARHIAACERAESLVCVAGGGDTVAALAHAGLTSEVTYVSTAGGAFLEWLEGKPLPGVQSIKSSSGIKQAS